MAEGGGCSRDMESEGLKVELDSLANSSYFVSCFVKRPSYPPALSLSPPLTTNQLPHHCTTRYFRLLQFAKDTVSLVDSNDICRPKPDPKITGGQSACSDQSLVGTATVLAHWHHQLTSLKVTICGVILETAQTSIVSAYFNILVSLLIFYVAHIKLSWSITQAFHGA